MLTLKRKNRPKGSVCTNMIYFWERDDGTHAGKSSSKRVRRTQQKKKELEPQSTRKKEKRGDRACIKQSDKEGGNADRQHTDDTNRTEYTQMGKGGWG